MISLKTRRLSAQRLITPLLITTSAQGPTILDRQILDDALAELDISEVHRLRRRAGSAQHLVGHIDANDLTFGPDLFRSDKAVEAATRSEVDDALSRPQLALRKRIADTGKCLDCAVWHSGDHGIVIAQASSRVNW
jgi:hypothetical protein